MAGRAAAAAAGNTSGRGPTNPNPRFPSLSLSGNDTFSHFPAAARVKRRLRHPPYQMAVSIGHYISCSQSSDVFASVKIKHLKRRLRATPIGKLLLGTPSTRIPPLLLSERRWIFPPATGNPCLPQVTVECTHSTTLAITISFVSPIIIAARGGGGVFCVFLGHFSTFHTLFFSGGF